MTLLLIMLALSFGSLIFSISRRWVFFPAILLSAGWLMMMLLVWQTGGVNADLDSVLVNEACMRKIEKKAGLVNCYRYAAGENPEKPELLLYRDDDRTDIYFILNREMRMGKLIFTPGQPVEEEIHPSDTTAYWRYDVLRRAEGVRYHASNGTLICFTYGYAAIFLWLFAVAFLNYRVRKKIALPALLLLILWLGWALYPGHRTWQTQTPPGEVQKTLKKAEHQLAKLARLNTGIIGAGDSRNPINRELLVGGTDFFEQPFLSWAIGDYAYFYYFPAAPPPPAFFFTASQLTRLDDRCHLVEYPAFSKNNRLILIAYLLWLIPLLAAPALLICRERTK